MAQIFMSYAREDEQRVQPLIQILQKEGWSVFWDRRIPAGQTWRGYIGKALDSANCVVVTWSRHSIASTWVSEEAESGKQRGILVPVLLDAVEPPLGFRSIQAADISDLQGAGSSERVERLLSDIKMALNSNQAPIGNSFELENVSRQPQRSQSFHFTETPEATGLNTKVTLWDVLLGVGVAFAPYIFVWFLLRKGYSNIARYIGFGWLVFVIVVLIINSNNAVNTAQP
jgi:hypothetical protein